MDQRDEKGHKSQLDNNKVSLVWVMSYKGISDNEMAELAKYSTMTTLYEKNHFSA